MTKKHFIALADAIREFNDAGLQSHFGADQVDCLAVFCQRQNPRFNMQRWVDYIGGHCGPNGGKIKTGKAHSFGNSDHCQVCSAEEYEATFENDRNTVRNALNECGVGEDLGERLNKINDELAEFCANLQKSVTRQAIYNELTNRPCGIEHRNALRMGLVSAIGNLVKWDIIDALELAADITEDVNAHDEARQIRAMAMAVSQ